MEINAEIKIKPEELLKSAKAVDAEGRAVLTVDGKPVVSKEFHPSASGGGEIRFSEKVELKPEHISKGGHAAEFRTGDIPHRHEEERLSTKVEVTKPPRTHVPEGAHAYESEGRMAQPLVPEHKMTKTVVEEMKFEKPKETAGAEGEFEEEERPTSPSYISPEYQKSQRGLLTRAADALIEAERAVAGTIGYIAHGTKETVVGAGQAVAETVETGFEKTADTLAGGAHAVKGAGEAVADVTKKAGEKIADTAHGAWEGTKSGASAVVEGTKKAGEKVVGTGEAIKESIPGFPDIEGRIAESLKPAPGQIEKEFEGLEKAKEAVKGLGKGMVEGTKEAGHKVADTTRAAGGKVSETARGAGEAITGAGKAVADSTRAAGHGIADTTRAAGRGIADTTRAAGEKVSETGKAVKGAMPGMPTMPGMPDIEGRIAESLKPAPGTERRDIHELPKHATERRDIHELPKHATAIVGEKREISGDVSFKPLSQKEKEEFERINQQRIQNLPESQRREHIPVVHKMEENLPFGQEAGHGIEHEFHHLPSPLREQMIDERRKFFEKMAKQEGESALSYPPPEHLPPVEEVLRLHTIPPHPSVRSKAEIFEHHGLKPEIGSTGPSAGIGLQQQGTTIAPGQQQGTTIAPGQQHGTTIAPGPKGEITVTKTVVQESETIKPVPITEETIKQQWKTLDRSKH